MCWSWSKKDDLPQIGAQKGVALPINLYLPCPTTKNDPSLTFELISAIYLFEQSTQMFKTTRREKKNYPTRVLNKPFLFLLLCILDLHEDRLEFKKLITSISQRLHLAN